MVVSQAMGTLGFRACSLSLRCIKPLAEALAVLVHVIILRHSDLILFGSVGGETRNKAANCRRHLKQKAELPVGACRHAGRIESASDIRPQLLASSQIP